MSVYDMILMALRNLYKRKLRTFLTVLGVIIGTASIVVMISVGIGMNEGFKQQLEQMGSLSVIEVYKPWNGGDINSQEVTLDTKMIDTFNSIEGVEIATPLYNQYFKIGTGRYVADFSVTGIYPEAMEPLGYKLESGRFLTEEDGLVAILGAYTLSEFYNPKLSWQYRWNNSQDIVIDVENSNFKVSYDYSYGENSADSSIKAKSIDIVGVLSQEARDSWSSVMPLEQVEKMAQERAKYNGEKNFKTGVYDQAKVKVSTLDDVARVQEEIKNLGFETYSLMDNLNAMQETSKMLQLVLGAIGAISLLVAAIGITNTMVMSIYERTREIGVMKVIGATIPDIKGLFLTEAAFIGLMGGILGVILSYGVSYGVNIVGQGMGQNTLSLIPPWLSLASIGFATVIGVVAGYLPAKRATALSALAAIRTE